MNTILKRLGNLGENELHALSEAIDGELERRMEIEDSIPDSARRRAVQRSQSYRRETGMSAPPVRITGLRTSHKSRRAA